VLGTPFVLYNKDQQISMALYMMPLCKQIIFIFYSLGQYLDKWYLFDK